MEEQQPHRQAPTTTGKESRHTHDRQAQQLKGFLKFANSCRKRPKIFRFRFNEDGAMVIRYARARKSRTRADSRPSPFA